MERERLLHSCERINLRGFGFNVRPRKNRIGRTPPEPK